MGTLPVYSLNENAVEHAKQLIDSRQYLAAHELLQYLDRKIGS